MTGCAVGVAYDNITERTFGSYVSIYDFKRAVEDGATVPLYYENRGEKLGIDHPHISEGLLQAVENANLDVNEKAKVELELLKMEKRELDKEYKRPDHPLRIISVCAMWPTGFDVKSLAVMHIDKPLKAHTRMQTIARANRVYEGKSNG